jgi:BirA family biotin operon repressor/biotin-[acetyl-CoA-carboxylase] ligase
VVERWGPAGRERRKLAGILAEGAVLGDGVSHVILGIGINVCETAYPPELADRVTSIAGEAGRDVAPCEVLAGCVTALADRWRAVVAGRSAEMLAEWRRRSPSAVGASVIVSTERGHVQGVTRGLANDGSLRVELPDRIVNVVAGEVQWV